MTSKMVGRPSRARQVGGQRRKETRQANVAVGLAKLGAVGGVVPAVRVPVRACGGGGCGDGGDAAAAAALDHEAVDIGMHASTAASMRHGASELLDAVGAIEIAAGRLADEARRGAARAAELRRVPAARARAAALERRVRRWRRHARAYGSGPGRGEALRATLDRELSCMTGVLAEDARRLAAEGRGALPERLTHVTVMTSAPAGSERARGEGAPRRGLRNSVTRWDMVAAALHGLAGSARATTFGQVANFCPACGSPLATVPLEGRMLCVRCRTSFADPAAETVVAGEGGGGKVVSHRANQTRVYVVEKLNQMQARHPGVISVEDMVSVMRHMYERMAVRSPAAVEAITRAQTQAAMRAVGFTSYVMVSRVKMGLTGIRPPQLDPVLKAEVLHMMDIIQFDSRIMRKRNENNLSLYYCILHCLLMRGRPEFMPEMSIIRGTNNLLVKDLSQMYPIFQKNDWGPFWCMMPQPPVPYACTPLPPGSRSFGRAAARAAARARRPPPRGRTPTPAKRARPAARR